MGSVWIFHLAYHSDDDEDAFLHFAERRIVFEETPPKVPQAVFAQVDCRTS
jgi:hypothetical protein